MDSRIDRVELFEDRAAITRVALVEAGRHTIRLGPVSPLTVASRVTTPRIAGDAEWVLEDVRIERRRRLQEETDDARLASLRTEERDARETHAALRDACRRANASLVRNRGALAAATEATSNGLLSGEEPKDWVGALRTLAAAAERCAVASAEAEHQRAEASAELQRVAQALEAATRGTTVEEAVLVLQVHASTAGPIRVRTTIPCGLWRPAHRARLDDSELHWEVRAACWNATGVPWKDVELVCSTARPGQHADPPNLTDDRVHTIRRSTEIVVEQREEEVFSARVSGTATGQTLPGVDDGGEARVYTAPERVSIPSDGQPVFIGLEAFTMPCETSWSSVPSQKGVAVLRSIQSNGSARPLLAGPVELVRGSMAVGRTSVKLVPSGERFEVGWGNHDGVRLVRKQEQEVDHATLSGKQTHSIDVQIRVSHLGTDPLVLSIEERIPVSEVKQVAIRLVESVPELTRRPDSDGLCGWRIELEPGVTRTFSLRYEVVASKNISLPI